MTATDTEGELRLLLRSDAARAALSYDVSGGLYRWRLAVTQRRGARRRALAVVAAAAAMAAILSASAWAGAWYQRNSGPPTTPSPRPTHVSAIELGAVTIDTYGRPDSASGYFTLSVAAGALDQGTYRTQAGNWKIQELTGSLGELVISLGEESITPPPDRVGTRYAWTLDSATGAYAGVSGGGVAVALTVATGPVITWELTGTLVRSGSPDGAAASDPLAPADVLISSLGVATSPRGDGRFTLQLGTGITDTGSIHMIGTPWVRADGTTSLTRSYHGALGGFQMQLTFGPAGLDGTTVEHWSLGAATGRYTGLHGSGTGTFAPAFGPATQEFLRGPLSR